MKKIQILLESNQRVLIKSQMQYHIAKIDVFFIYTTCFSGAGGIRTHEAVKLAGFQDQFLKPLGHHSI